MEIVELFSVLRAFSERKQKAREAGQVDNSSLRAGAPMYFYCRKCGKFLTTLGENYTQSPPKLCSPCERLDEAAWSESKLRCLAQKKVNCRSCGGSGGRYVRDYYVGSRFLYCESCSNGKITVNVEPNQFKVVVEREAPSAKQEQLKQKLNDLWVVEGSDQNSIYVARTFSDEDEAIKVAKHAREQEQWLSAIVGIE